MIKTYFLLSILNLQRKSISSIPDLDLQYFLSKTFLIWKLWKLAFKINNIEKKNLIKLTLCLQSYFRTLWIAKYCNYYGSHILLSGKFSFVTNIQLITYLSIAVWVHNFTISLTEIRNPMSSGCLGYKLIWISFITFPITPVSQ